MSAQAALISIRSDAAPRRALALALRSPRARRVGDGMIKNAEAYWVIDLPIRRA